jgi:hypothetical protein
VTSNRLGRVLASAAGLLAIALVVGGCGAVQNVTDHLTGQTATPKVGDCWRVTYADAAQSEDWEGTGAVACSGIHESYTYAVTKLGRKFTGSWLDSKGNPRADVDAAAFKACRARQKALLPAITPTEALFYPTYYVPSVAQWNNGARWVRCDMTEIKVGSDIAKPHLTTLPAKFADLVKQVVTTPKKFALCENDPANNGPDGEHTMYADCTGPTDWTFRVRLPLAGGATAPYPGAALLKQLGTTKCAAAVTAPAGNDIFAKTPSQSAWVQEHVRTVDCWVNNN